MRLLMDYYFVLRDFKTKTEETDSAKNIKNICEVVSDLGLERFASALMWVLGHVFTSASSSHMFIKKNGCFGHLMRRMDGCCWMR